MQSCNMYSCSTCSDKWKLVIKTVNSILHWAARRHQRSRAQALGQRLHQPRHLRAAAGAGHDGHRHRHGRLRGHQLPHPRRDAAVRPSSPASNRLLVQPAFRQHQLAPLLVAQSVFVGCATRPGMSVCAGRNPVVGCTVTIYTVIWISARALLSGASGSANVAVAAGLMLGMLKRCTATLTACLLSLSQEQAGRTV